MKNLENNYDLIAKTLSGKASKEEITLLEAWENESVDNAVDFELSKKIFAGTKKFKNEYPVNVNAAWNKVEQRIKRLK